VLLQYGYQLLYNVLSLLYVIFDELTHLRDKVDLDIVQVGKGQDQALHLIDALDSEDTAREHTFIN
jgi:hypothetical protein